MNLIVISASLRPGSNSRVLAKHALRQVEAVSVSGRETKTQWVDLRDYPLPLCDGDAAYGHPNVAKLTSILSDADVILIAVPIYNYDINAAVKNLVELTGSAWEDKTVGFLCAAGGRASYMSVMNLANDLMLDFRAVIVPRFVYAVHADFETRDGDIQIATPEIRQRVDELAEAAVSLGHARQLAAAK